MRPLAIPPSVGFNAADRQLISAIEDTIVERSQVRFVFIYKN